MVADDAFQVMPPLTAEELDALEQDIVERGVVVPVVVDQYDRTLDGHHRRAIAGRLGLPCPVEVRHVVDDEDARQIALALNLSRRHVTREQRRELVAQECQARPQDSDRAIARRLGCSPSTVAAVRRPVSKLDRQPLAPAQAERLSSLEDEVRTNLDAFDEVLFSLPPLVAVRVLRDSWRGLEERHGDDEEFLGPLRRVIYEQRLDALLAEGVG